MSRSNADVGSRYIAHGLALIRAANGMSRRSSAELANLSRELRAILIGADPAALGRRDLDALVRQLTAAIEASYGAISDAQRADLAELVTIEAEFAQRASAWGRAPSQSAIDAAVAGLLVLGAKPADAWAKLAADLAYRVGAAVRAGAAAGQDAAAIRDAALGLGRAGTERGGPMEAARRAAAALVDTAAHAAAGRGRLATFAVNGVQAVKWFAVLDSRVCPYCGGHAGKLWALDGAPIGHDVALGPHPPAHWWCRCILLPMQWAGGPPPDGGAEKDTFQTWLDTLAPQEQDAILGRGRADLWRRGVITLTDLIGQNGQTISLAELRAHARQ